ncbi:MAG: hypothetical protein WA584_11945 [Pyrinomonadaceae bacterium]
MDIFESGIPDIKIVNFGTWRNPLEFIRARIVLEAWDGYLYKHWENGKEITDGKVALDFGGYKKDILWDWKAEINAYHYLIQNQHLIRDNIIKSLTAEVNRFTQYLDSNDSFVPNITPETRGYFDFKPFIGPESIDFVEESKDDVSYLEWRFQCAWDSEHGFAVTTHKERVIHIDQDTDIWKIYEDNGTLAEKRKEYDERAKNSKPPKRQNPWWKFW